jgi:hypothetical protein
MPEDGFYFAKQGPYSEHNTVLWLLDRHFPEQV